MLAHAPPDFMMWLGWLHLLSIPLALVAGLLGGWPGGRKLARGLAFTALILSLPVLVVLPFLPSMLGSDAAAAILLLLVAPVLSGCVFLALRRWN